MAKPAPTDICHDHNLIWDEIFQVKQPESQKLIEIQMEIISCEAQ